MTFRTVDSVMLYVRDLEVSIAFYRDVVRLPFKFKESGYAEFAMEGTKFGLLERSRLPGLIGREATEGGPESRCCSWSTTSMPRLSGSVSPGPPS